MAIDAFCSYSAEPISYLSFLFLFYSFVIFVLSVIFFVFCFIWFLTLLWLLYLCFCEHGHANLWFEIFVLCVFFNLFFLVSIFFLVK